MPTAREAGVEFELTGWQGIVGPAGLPRLVVDQVNAAVRRALADPEVARRVRQQGNEATPSTPEELARMVATGRETMGRVITAANIRAD